MMRPIEVSNAFRDPPSHATLTSHASIPAATVLLLPACGDAPLPARAAVVTPDMQARIREAVR
jgi:hypothetical protein